MSFRADEARKVMAEIGRRGGLARSPALTEARRHNGRLGGRPPDPAVVRTMIKVADAIDHADATHRPFLIEAFRRLAPESLYQERWKAAWGEKLTPEARRHLRGWGPVHRERAAQAAREVLAQAAH